MFFDSEMRFFSGGQSIGFRWKIGTGVNFAYEQASGPSFAFVKQNL